MQLTALKKEPVIEAKQSAPPAVAKRWQSVITFCNSAPFAYIALACVVVRVMWQIWDYKDLTNGDSTSYYRDACLAYNWFKFNPAWSPLFALFGAMVLHIQHEPLFYFTTIRMTCVMTLAMLSLAVGRKLLPPTLAWLASAWWISLPITFNSLYEIHLFATIPYLLSWVILLGNNESRWRRGITLALIACCTLLVRNEESVYFALLLLLVLGNEIWRFRRREKPESWSQIAIPYLAPMAVTAFLVLGVYIRSYVTLNDLPHVFRHKHTNNVGQIYCFGFQQRHPGIWNKSPWVEYGDLMCKTFGAPEVTMTEAIRANPKAMAEHFAWNASMIPTGLQFVLFNRVSSPITPDYVEPRKSAWQANLLSALVLIILAAGSVAAWRQRSDLVEWSKQRSWGLAAIACYTPVAFFVMLMQRPRPSYILAFGFTLILMTGFASWRLLGKSKLAFVASNLAPLAMMAVFVLSPPYYPRHAEHGRTTLEYLEFLKPYAKLLDDGKKTYVKDHLSELPIYLYTDQAKDRRSLFTNAVYGPEKTVPEMMERLGIYHAMADTPMDGPDCFNQLAESKEWKLIGLKQLENRKLALYIRSSGQ